jgi:glycolate oxidase iron-sulfur subunit
MLESSLAAARALVNKRDIPPWVRLARGDTPAAGGPVALFSGCTARNVRPQWAEKAEALLRACGYTVLTGESFTCCGGTMRHAGRFAVMAAMRRANVDAWKAMGKPRIAAFCASCYHGLAGYADGFLEGGEAEEWRKSLTPLSALPGGMRAEFLAARPERYGYHQPCHWDTDADMPFLSGILPGLVKGAGICCGMGGILKMTDPGISASMARTCLDAMPQGAAHILTGCSGCAVQLAAFAPRGMTVLHWLDAVAVA